MMDGRAVKEETVGGEAAQKDLQGWAEMYAKTWYKFLAVAYPEKDRL